MMNSKEQLLSQSRDLIRQGEKVLGTELEDKQPNPQASPRVSEVQFHEFRISALSFLSRVFTNNSVFYQNFTSEVTHPTSSRTRRGVAILQAAENELDGNWLETTRGVIAKEVLTDMLRLARTQSELEHHAAAVIIAVSILEKHLRLVASTAGIILHNTIDGKAVAKRGLQLVGEVYKKKVIDRETKKTITQWFELAETASAPQGSVNAKEAKKLITEIQNLIAKASY